MQTLTERTRDLDARREGIARQLRGLAGDGARAGLTERRIASLMGRSQPEAHRLITASAARAADGTRRWWMTARELTDAVEQTLPDEPMALRVMLSGLEQLRTLVDAGDIAEWAVTPRHLSHRPFDTLFQALTARAFDDRPRPRPDWVDPQPLDREWGLAMSPSRRERARAQRPADLRALRIAISGRSLVTA